MSPNPASILEKSGYNRDRKLKIVGTSPVKHDGIDKVTGRAKFGADLFLPGMLVGKILRSPHAHANIRSIDTSAAEALPGVKAVVTRAEEVLKALDEGREGHKPLARIDDLPLFAASAPMAATKKVDGFEEAMRAIEPDTLTPKQALELIYKLKLLISNQK